MTTACTKPVARLTSVALRDGGKRRLLVVTLHSTFLELRLQGTRRTEIVDLEASYFGAVKARVFSERMAKAKARAAKVKARK
jgi:hypothetical protein